jgi:signal transduction histidine kinase
MLAHDLRSPLAAVMTNLEYLERSSPGWPRESAEALSDAQLSCGALTHLIGNLDVVGGTWTASKASPVALIDIARSSASRFGRHARLSDVSIDVRESAPVPAVLAPPSPLERALDNLVSNAVEHASRGSVVRVSVERHGDSGAIVVADDGPIVPEDLREAVLTAEGQIAYKRRPECRYGRGLALFCAARAAEAAGGRVTVSERGGQSLLLLLMPVTAER